MTLPESSENVRMSDFAHPHMNHRPAPQPPLTDEERRLIQRAENWAWTDELREMLATKVKRRGAPVGNYDTCGDLVEMLEALTR